MRFAGFRRFPGARFLRAGICLVLIGVGTPDVEAESYRIRVVTDRPVAHPDTSRFFAAFLDALPGAGFQVGLVPAGEPGGGGPADNVRAALAASPDVWVLRGPKSTAAAATLVSEIPEPPVAVYCGVRSGDAAEGLPRTRAVGLPEADLGAELLAELGAYAEGDRIGFLGPDTPEARRAAERWTAADPEAVLAFVSTPETWREAFEAIQDRADRLILHEVESIFPEIPPDLPEWVADHLWIPAGTLHEFMAPLALVALAPDPAEAGRWAAETASALRSGTAPEAIPPARTRKARMILNLKIARALGAAVSVDAVEFADRVLE